MPQQWAALTKPLSRGLDSQFYGKAAVCRSTASAIQCRGYEEAAVLRDLREALESLHEQLQRFREAQRHYSFIYPVFRSEGGCLWYLIRCGQVYLAIDEAHNGLAADECLAVIERIYAGGTPSVNHDLREDVEMTLLIASRFCSRPDDLQRTLSPDEVEKRQRAMCAANGD